MLARRKLKCRLYKTVNDASASISYGPERGAVDRKTKKDDDHSLNENVMRWSDCKKVME